MRKWFHLSVPLIDGESGRDQKVSSLEKIDCIIIIIIIIIIILFLLLLSSLSLSLSLSLLLLN